ncbi:ankyrin repeat domain-containing protein [Paenibacillus gansuensis]|uniref:Ankyrin repeat domain-containing protein n=1 Tax=Paenibacillus gansuensis TaxID=306542 RepID=A0ABW5PAR2_9BACL
MENNNLSPELVQLFVGQAHGDFQKVQELLEQEPGLLNASWDWGNGDWETALGAAAHMGRKDIANYLLDKGARIDLFAAAMLDKVEIVKALISDNLALKDSLGPHRIPLINHAEAGEATAVMNYLKSIKS